MIRVYEKTAARDGLPLLRQRRRRRATSAPRTCASATTRSSTPTAPATDRQLGIPGEDLPGSHAATEFVAWYNAHPDFADRSSTSRASGVVIGNGNVAADVARMLALTRPSSRDRHRRPRDRGAGRVGRRGDRVLGRRGPAQAAFTNPELRELGEMTDADIVVDPAEVELDEVSREFLDSEDADITNAQERRDLQRVLAARAGGQAAADRPALPRSPVEIQGAARSSGRRRAQRARARRRRPVRARTPASARRSSAGWCCARSATRASASTACRSTSAGAIPNDHGRVVDQDRAARCPGITSSAGSSAAPAA